MKAKFKKKNTKGYKVQDAKQRVKPSFSGYPREAGGGLTAAAILDDYWDEISKNWKAESTYKGNISILKKVILPHMRDRSLESFNSLQAYEGIIDKIQAHGQIRSDDGQEYSPSTLQGFRSLIRKIVKVAADHGVCLDILWGTYFSAPTIPDPDVAEEEIRTRLRKSLAPKEEYALADLIFTDEFQSGEYMFALLMWALGGRPQEVADIRWSDIRPISAGSDRYVIALLTTVYNDGSKVGGKTKNMFRFVPISPKLYAFLMKRKDAVQAAFDAHKENKTLPPDVTSVDDLFICCHGDNYFKRCNVRGARNICRDLLRRIGMSESLFHYFEKEAAKSDDIILWGKEKSVTSYVLRRHFCTILFALGLIEEEIFYSMGHSMEQVHFSKRRSDYRYPPFMEALWEKMSYRPILNDPPDWEAQAFNIHEQHANLTLLNVPRKAIRAKGSAGGGRLEIRITPNEAGDPIQIGLDVATADGKTIPITGEYRTIPARGDQRLSVNVLDDLIRIYRVSKQHLKATNRNDDAKQENTETEAQNNVVVAE